MGRKKVKVHSLEELEEGERFQLANNYHIGMVMNKSTSSITVLYENYKELNHDLISRVIKTTIAIAPGTQVIKMDND